MSVLVEIAPGADLKADPATWPFVEITPDVRTKSNIAITGYGRRDEGTRVDPGEMSLVLNNREGRYSPRNPLGPWFGKLRRNTPIRVTKDGSVRFSGFVAEWPTRWDRSGNDSWVPVKAAGIARRLIRRNRPLHSALRRQISTHPDVIAYWPLEDNHGADSAAPGLEGLAPIILPSRAEMGAGQNHPHGTLPGLLSIKPGTGTILGRVPAHTPTNNYGFAMLFRADELTSTFRVMATLEFTGSDPAVRWQIEYSSSSIRIRSIDDDGGTVQTDSINMVDGFTGRWLYLLVRFFQNPTSISFSAFLRDAEPDQLHVLPIIASVSGSLGGSPTLGVLTNAGWARGPAGATPAERLVGHFAAFRSTILSFMESAVHGFTGERTADRITRLCGEEGLQCEIQGDPADTGQMGPQRAGPLIALLRECEDRDGGVLGESLSAPGFGLLYRTLVDHQNQAPALTIGRDQLLEAPLPTDDDQRLLSLVEVKRHTGSSFVASDPDAQEGGHESSVEVNTATDLQLQFIAWHLLARGMVDEMRWPSMIFSLVAHPDLVAPWLAVRLGDRMIFENAKDQIPGVEVDQVIEGWVESFRVNGDTWTVELVASPYSPFVVATFGQSRFGGKSTLAAQFEAGVDTSMSVATASGPLWTTDAGDFPLDLEVSGVVLRVTAASGASSPQTFTVEQGSVNGITKTIPAGETVRLHPEPRFALGHRG